MLKTNMSKSNMLGYTIIELLVVTLVVGILAGLAFGVLGDSRAKGRDTERVTDIDNLASRLEEYRTDKGGYPSTFSASTFGGLDPEALKDPNGVSIVIASTVSDQVAAQAVASPTSSANYKYIPYSCGTTCTGYVLKGFIEKPNTNLPNPYVKTGISNN